MVVATVQCRTAMFAAQPHESFPTDSILMAMARMCYDMWESSSDSILGMGRAWPVWALPTFPRFRLFGDLPRQISKAVGRALSKRIRSISVRQPRLPITHASSMALLTADWCRSYSSVGRDRTQMMLTGYIDGIPVDYPTS